MANAIDSLTYGSNTYTFTTPYGTCSTAAATAAKTVTVTNFSLEAGAKITVKFTYANSVASPTLNVNSTGAKAIYWNGAALASSQYWQAGAVLDFVYNGTQWDLIGIAKDNNTTYSAATASTAGLMSASDKSKLDGIASGANAYTHPTYTARTGKPTANQTPAFGGTATVSQITSDGTGHVTGATDRTITIPSTLSNGTGTAGLIKTSSTVTSNSGYTACPVISGVPYYKDTDTNTTYSAGTGISLSGTTFSNSGVRSIATGSSNGTISVNTNGTSANVAVKGLGTAAYTASTAYATAAQGTLATNAMPKAGGTFTGAVTHNAAAYFNSSTYMKNNVYYSAYDADGNECNILGINSTGQLQLGVSGNFTHPAATVIISKNSDVKLKNSASYSNSDERSIEYSGNYFRPSVNNVISLGTEANAWYQVGTQRLYVYGGKPVFAYIGTNGSGSTVSYAVNMYVNSDGIVSRSTNTSSKTIKHDIKDLEDETIRAEKLYDLPVHQAKYNADVLDEDDDRYLKDLPMFIIEEMAEIYPAAVDKPSDNVKEWSWNAQYMIPPMLKLIQEQKKEIDSHTETINELKAEINALKEALNL